MATLEDCFGFFHVKKHSADCYWEILPKAVPLPKMEKLLYCTFPYKG